MGAKSVLTCPTRGVLQEGRYEARFSWAEKSPHTSTIYFCCRSVEVLLLWEMLSRIDATRVLTVKDAGGIAPDTVQ